MADTTNYGWAKPTVGASNNSWGTELNAAFDDVDTDLKAVETKADDAQADADALDTRVDALEAQTPYGLTTISNAAVFGVTNSGNSTESISRSANTCIIVPFNRPGVYNAIFCPGSSSGVTLGVFDATSAGDPGTILKSVTPTNSNDWEPFASPLTITRPCFLAYHTTSSLGSVRTQSPVTGVCSPLGSELDTSLLTHEPILSAIKIGVVSLAVSGGSGFTRYEPGTNGWALMLALRTV